MKVRELPDTRRDEIGSPHHGSDEEQDAVASSTQFTTYATKTEYISDFPSAKQQRQGEEHAGIYKRLLTSTRRPIKIGEIHLPQIGKVVCAAFSAHFDRIAWTMETDGKMTLWVARINGAGIHAVGSIERCWASDGFEPYSHLQWLPDGERLSFVYHDAVYTVHTE